MEQSYLNRWGIRYYLPEFGPPVRWLATNPYFSSPDIWTLAYYECDAQNLGMRAFYLYADGRVTLAFPGGPDGDRLPEGALGSVEQCKARGETREISELEFNTIWAALSRLPEDHAELKPLLDLTNSTEQAAFAPFVGTWAPAGDVKGLGASLMFSANGVVVSMTENSEVDLMKYSVENGVALVKGAGTEAECEIVDSELVLRISGEEVGNYIRTE